MKTAQRRYKEHQDRQILNALENIELGPYVYLERLPMTTSATGRLATES